MLLRRMANEDIKQMITYLNLKEMEIIQMGQAGDSLQKVRKPGNKVLSKCLASP